MTIEGTEEVNGTPANQSNDEGAGEIGEARGNPDPWAIVDKLNAKIDLMDDRFGELQSALAKSRQAAAPMEEEIDYDDEEPLTARKVAKIIQSSTQRATAQSQAESQRQLWDGKAKEEFPLTDPTFEREFRRQWRDFHSAGMDTTHPRSLYQVAKATAQAIGSKSVSTKPANTGRAGNDMQDSEAPSGQSSRSSSRSKSAIDDSDPRVAFYRMKGNKSEDQIKAFKERLSAQDAKKRRA